MKIADKIPRINILGSGGFIKNPYDKIITVLKPIIIETMPIDFSGSLFAHRIIKSLNGTNGMHIKIPIKNSIIINIKNTNYQKLD